MLSCSICFYARPFDANLCCVKSPPALHPQTGLAQWPAVNPDHFCGSFTPASSSTSLEQVLSNLPIESDLLGPYCQIPLSQGRFAKVDPEYYIRLSQFRWHCLSDFKTRYAARTIWHNGKSHKIFMHRLIAKTPPHLVCDHINGCTLDNRFQNLRNCTIQQNNFNSKGNPNASSKYKGVFYSKLEKKFVASITLNSKHFHLGYFQTEEAAALAYDKKAKELFGQFAFLNFPAEPQT
jgi:hypothetical protein